MAYNVESIAVNKAEPEAEVDFEDRDVNSVQELEFYAVRNPSMRGIESDMSSIKNTIIHY